jgi:glycosyltransferase involved in cell wall biosynthesis
VETWGRRQREEGPLQKVSGRAADLLRIRRRILLGGYDLVFVNTTHDLRAMVRDLMLVTASPRHVRWVLLIHGSHFTEAGLLVDAVARRLARMASATLLLSSAEVKEWKQFCPQGRYHLVANALAPVALAAAPAAPEPQAVPEVLYAGRLIREKGLYELLEAFARVRSGAEAHLIVAGEGPEAGGLQQRAEELGIAGDVTFTGHLAEEDLAALYRRATLLVLPSYSEGLPTVILEALAFGLPIVTTPIRGAADHLVEGTNALFVPPRESAPLADAIGTLLADPELRATMREANLAKASEFAPERVAEEYVRVFQQVMRGEGS